MIRVYVVCEGQTEETFIRDVIAPVLASSQIFLRARLISTSKGNKGGALSYERVRRFIINSLKQEQDTVVTTFFDLYALDTKFPAFIESKTIADVYRKVAQLECAFKQDIARENIQFSQRFLPYIQPYEFEGLLFSDIEKLIEIEATWKNAMAALREARKQAPTPEHINDGCATKPSARLAQHLTHTSYRKVLHGTLGIQNIGIEKLLSECKHFEQWYRQLVDLNKFCSEQK